MKQSSDWKSTLLSIENTLLPYFTTKLPSLPADIKKLLVQLTPIYAIISVVLGILGLLVLIGLGTLIAPISFMFGVTSTGVFQPGYILTILFLIPTTILQAMAIQPLSQQRKKGWDLLFYAALLQFVSNVVEFNIFGAVISALISLYLLYQIREYYKLV